MDFPITEEEWALVEGIVFGESRNRISLTAAAKAIGVHRNVLVNAIERSRLKMPEDPPWTRHIHTIWDQRDIILADRLEDLAWEKAQGAENPDGSFEKGDTRVLMAMLAARDSRYRPVKSKQDDNKDIDAETIRRALASQVHMEDIQQIEQERATEGVKEKGG